ncbi:MAG: response regulator [bacterium]|nr:response regulator [bacterium]
MEVLAADGTRLILDSGTGIHDLGQALVTDKDRPSQGHLLITHTHWDHIQGFPFFAPLFLEEKWNVYAPGDFGTQLENVLGGQMSYAYFPISLAETRAIVQFHPVGEGQFDIGPFRIRVQYMNHPVLTVGYRIETGEASVVYISDHEPNSLYPIGENSGVRPIHHEDRRHVDFLARADLLIHDAQFTLEEYRQKQGWGHSPVEKAVDYALAGQVKRLALFHHDPLRTDEAVDGMVEKARRRGESAGASLEIGAATEGEIVELRETESGSFSPLHPGESAIVSGERAGRPDTVMVVEDDRLSAAMLKETLQKESLRVVVVEDGESAVRAFQIEKPSLVVLDLVLPLLDGLEVCRSIRNSAEPGLRDIPILIVTGKKLEEKDIISCFEAGATDYMTKPVSPTRLRSRVRGWLHRSLVNR